MRANSRSRSPPKGKGKGGAKDSPIRGGLFGANFPLGIDTNKITEEEISKFLKETSIKSLEQIARETEKLAGDNNDGVMVRGSDKISLTEIEEFMKGISLNDMPKVNKKDLKEYLSAFPYKGMGPDGEVKIKKSDLNFLLNGKHEMDAKELHQLLSNTMIQDFDPVEEAFRLLDVEEEGFLTMDTFKRIFEKLKLGTIEEQEESIFMSVADFDGDKKISLDDFRRILQYNAEEDDDIEAYQGKHMIENHGDIADNSEEVESGDDDFPQ